MIYGYIFVYPDLIYVKQINALGKYNYIVLIFMTDFIL
jgi:hypothetical protein